MTPKPSTLPLYPMPRALNRRQGLQWLGAGLLAAAPLGQASAEKPSATLRVGKLQAVKTLAVAAKVARDGMLIEVEAGDYPADVAAWPQSQLSLRAVGGRVRMLANGAAAQGKGIFVMSGDAVSIEGFDFIGARVPDTNGAGIRLERGSLSVKDCSFSRCEMGLLTNNDPNTHLDLQGCEFSFGERPGSFSHLLYAGSIAKLSVSGCYFHHGMRGHLIKSRAALNHIFYNRLTDEIGGSASYELEFPNGGQAMVIGNVIQQSSGSDNPHMVSFGAEGYTWPKQELQLIHNTLVDLMPTQGVYLRVKPGPAKARLINNLLAGNRIFNAESGWEQAGNHLIDLDEFVLAARENYALRPNSHLRGKAVEPGEALGLNLRPTRQYQHPRSTVALLQPARHPGAIQLP
ncbi:hypothetical protein [Paucibacter sp. Y2R2-4]|uniref:hypothetical protein n=1 Tax=Paucibacter sp. Y2R2-4 TaxID=2893553 RepID=UPI0021E3BD8C|nr:hypothetical protein [Paucibacter sp. Y2R2-4]MCV2350607.1 hypothetical protein [Paucibacter sp. Y2R2-4]